MSSSLLSLGQTVHCSVKHRWQLASEASIQVDGIAEIAQATTNLQQLELLTNREIWTKRGHGLRLSIQVLLDGEKVAGAPGAAEVLESLGVSLRDAELWSQLGILPTLSLPVISGITYLNQHGDIVLSLAHISPSGTAPGPLRGRKCRPADIRAAQPPDGVLTVGLESIDMTLNLSRHYWRPNSKALHREEKSPLCSYLPIKEHFSDLQQREHIQPMGNHQTLCSKDVDMDRWSLSRPPCPTDDEMLDCLSSDTSDQLILSHVENDATRTAQDRDYRMSLETGNNLDVESRQMHAGVELHHLLELTDAALRTLISVNPVRTSAGIRLLAASPGPKLAQISPALFSPGYLTAVSQRTPFVSTIAYTMSSLSRRVLSPGLRKKLVRLASLSPPQMNVAVNNAEQETPCSDKIRKVIKARIWRMIQKTLYNPGAARRLSPIEASGDAIHSRSPDEMLDDSFMLSLQTDFDSPLDKEELYNPFYTEEYLSRVDPGILENDYLDFDILISAGGSEGLESGGEDLLQHQIEYIRQEDQETSSNPKNTHTPAYNGKQLPIPCRVYTDNESHNTPSNSRGVDHPTTNDDEGIISHADGVGLPKRQETDSSLGHSPPSGTRSSTPNDNLTFTYESVLENQRLDDEEILFHSEDMMEIEEIHFSLSHTTSRSNDNLLFAHEHLLQMDRLNGYQDLLLPHELRFCIVKGGRRVNEYKSDDEDEDEMITI